MDAAEYKEMAVRIRAELESLEIQQEDIERRIARLKQALIGLIPLSEPPANSLIAAELVSYMESTTLTDAARQILQAAKAPLSPIEIKQQLINMGKDLSDQKNVMASVHSLLKRLVESGEIETKDNGLTYRWKWRRPHGGIRRRGPAYDSGMRGNEKPEPSDPIEETLSDVMKRTK
jgi:hypothetical protein